jgi:hypothetical protein
LTNCFPPTGISIPNRPDVLDLRQESTRLREQSQLLRQRSRFVLLVSQRARRRMDDLVTVSWFQQDHASRLLGATTRRITFGPGLLAFRLVP